MMTPHAVTPPPSDGDISPEVLSRTGSFSGNSNIASSPASVLPPVGRDELHDLICVGFGPASLAIAVALHDFAESTHGTRPPKVAILERQNFFAWHAGMQLPGATMQISWIKDLATLRNPRSHFTFLNYLHQAGRLVRFSNLGTFLPKRVEYEAYMKWAADHFSHLTSYGQEGLEVLPCRSENKALLAKDSLGPTDQWIVRSRNLITGEIEERRTRHVVLALGGRPRIPPCLPQAHPRVIHSSKYMSQIPSLLNDKEAPYTILVIGAGQSAAEIFHNLYSRYPKAKVRLLIRGSALKPSDDSPFVNETFNPEHVDNVYATEEALRYGNLLDEKATNYGVVRLELLEHIYADMYEESVRHPDRRPEDLQARILPFREVTEIDTASSSDRITVKVQNKEALHRLGQDQKPIVDEIEADALVVAAGYDRNAHEDLLQGARDLLPAASSASGRWAVNRDYSVQFAKGKVAKNSGVWLQGCNESTHGVSQIFSIDGRVFEKTKLIVSSSSATHCFPFCPFAGERSSTAFSGVSKLA